VPILADEHAHPGRSAEPELVEVPAGSREHLLAAAARPVKLAIVPPVTNPTSAPSGRPSRSSSQSAAASSTATVPGVAKRIPLFWSQAEVSQSAASAAGQRAADDPTEERPDGMAISPARRRRQQVDHGCGVTRPLR
jgi:hypothetical protein